MKIQYLSKQTYEKISAGEVIDRPASVVRELLDNAIDSEADQIDVTIADGGKKLIQIRDNGFGMSIDDLRICYHKHTTSKISHFDDIYQIVSMGFRGEALNAISIISEMEIISRTKDDEIGNSIIIKGGELIDERKTAANLGTNILIKNIFYNIPVRQKSLRSESSEFKHIKDIFIHKAIANYEKGFSLYHNGKQIYNLKKNQNILDRIREFYNDDLTKHLLEINQDYGIFSIKGYISEPNYFKTTKHYQLTFVNNRPVFSPSISHAINSAYETITPIGQHPITFIFIQISPQLIDVNIHPTKKEIKLLNEQAIHHAIYQLIKNNIQNQSSIPQIEINNSLKNSIHTFYKQNENKQPNLPHSQNIIFQKNKTVIDPKIEISNDSSSKNNYHVIGSLFNTYILIQREDELLLIDQHAAHERLQYEKLKSKINDNIPSHPLITSFVIEISKGDYNLVTSQLEQLLHLGFELNPFGDYTFIVHAIPNFLSFEESKQVLDYLIDKILDEDTLPSILEFLEESLKMNACRSSVKSGDNLKIEEVISLINELEQYPNPFACPHGRPTALRISKSEIEHFFLRKK